MSEAVLREEPTADTPLFVADKSAARIIIQGISMPENSFEFFDPLEKRTIELFKGYKGPLHMDIELTYLNSMSSKQLLRLIKILSSSIPDLVVNWKYQKDDDLIRIKGEDIKAICPKVIVHITEVL
jgi:hypothetical protein